MADDLQPGPKSAAEQEPNTTVVMIGVDNLATLEELLGANVGDDVCAALLPIMDRVIGTSGAVSEVGHRKFRLFLQDTSREAVETLIGDIQAEISNKAIKTCAGPVAVTASAGAVNVNAQLLEADDINIIASHALSRAAKRGVNGFHFAVGESALRREQDEAMHAAHAAIGALLKNEIKIAFQPVVRSDGGNTISFHECLARVSDDDGRLISAAAFMPAIEKLGLAAQIDRQILGMAFETMRNHPRARLSVNIHPHTMADRQWIEILQSVVNADPSLGERLIVEVTESAAMIDRDRTTGFMDMLREHGVSFALDDFGAGHTALRYLREFHFDMIKIDGFFVRGIRANPDNAFFVEKLVEIADRFEMMTIAEFVQNAADARLLAGLGVEFFQGFFFGSPSLMLEPTPIPMPNVAAQA